MKNIFYFLLSVIFLSSSINADQSLFLINMSASKDYVIEKIFEIIGYKYNSTDIMCINQESEFFFEIVEKYKPRVILFEYDPIYGPFIALEKMSKNNEYTLMAITEMHAFFVINEEIKKNEIVFFTPKIKQK